VVELKEKLCPQLGVIAARAFQAFHRLISFRSECIPLADAKGYRLGAKASPRSESFLRCRRRDSWDFFFPLSFFFLTLAEGKLDSLLPWFTVRSRPCLAGEFFADYEPSLFFFPSPPLPVFEERLSET